MIAARSEGIVTLQLGSSRTWNYRAGGKLHTEAYWIPRRSFSLQVGLLILRPGSILSGISLEAYIDRSGDQ